MKEALFVLVLGFLFVALMGHMFGGSLSCIEDKIMDGHSEFQSRELCLDVSP